MVKILHFADLHLGVENYGRLDPATGLHTRLLDFLRSLDELVEYALQEAVDLVLFAGDAYKNRDPNPTHQREFARRLYRLTQAGIPVFLLVGNHDLPNSLGRANTLDIFSTLQVPNVHVARRPGAQCVSTRSGPVQILALPWIVRSQLLAQEKYKGLSFEDIEALILQDLENLLTKELKRLDGALPTILAVHGTLQGAKYGSERSVMLGQDLVLPPSLFKHPGLDYVALGHIHRHQQVADSPPAVYSGSLERIDFGEEKEAKGFVVVDVEKGKAQWHFRELRSTRRFVTIDTRADAANPLDQIREAIAKHDIRDAIVRVIIHTTPDKSLLIRDQEIHALLSDAFKVAAIIKDVERAARLRMGSDQGIEQMTPLQALERYLQTRPISQERMRKLLQYAQHVISSEVRGDQD